MAAKNILVLCTGNSARSILGEVLLNRLGNGRLTAFSGGSQPVGAVHPAALRLLDRKGYDVTGLRSKSWNEFATSEALPIDVVITVCANAAGEACPAFPGRAVRAHWGLPDPARASGGETDQDQMFERTYDLLGRRVEAFLALPFEDMSDAELQQDLNVIGATEGAT